MLKPQITPRAVVLCVAMSDKREPRSPHCFSPQSKPEIGGNAFVSCCCKSYTH